MDDDDDDKVVPLRPIAGAPPDAPVPEMPAAQPEPDTGNDKPEAVAEPQEAHKMRSLPGPNEIGAILDNIAKKIKHHERWALREWIEGAKLPVIMADEHGYKGERYQQFAKDHLPIENPRDAENLYLLGYGTNGDDVLAECEAEARINPRFVTPHWRTVVARLRREAKKRARGEGTGDAEETGEDEADPVAQRDAEIVKLKAQVKAAAQQLYTTTQQYKSERIKREETEEEVERLRAKVADRDRVIDVLQIENETLKDRLRDQPAPPDEREYTEARMKQMSDDELASDLANFEHMLANPRVMNPAHGCDP